MIGLAVVVAVATLLVGSGLALALRLLPSVRTQLAGLALLAVSLPLAVVFLSGWAMFHMGDDVKILAVAAASASVAVGAALLLAASIAARIRRLRDASRAIAAGDLSARADEHGPRELAELARSFNTMAAELARLFDARRELVAWASHDLRTPIGSLRAMLEAVEDGLAEPEEYLPAINAQVRTLVGARRRPVRARLDRRRRAHARAARRGARRASSTAASARSRPRRRERASASRPT